MNGYRNSRTLLAAACLLALASPTAIADDAQPAAVAAKKSKKKKKRLKVRKIRPRSGRTFVPLDASIRIRFSRAVDPVSISDATISLRRLLGEQIPYAVEFEKKGKQLVLRPTGFLDPGRDYEVTVRFGIASDRGDQLKREARSIFFTDSTVPPFQFLRPDQFQALESEMAEGRAAHTSTRLEDGDVLIAGGMADGTRVSDTAELFDPDELQFRPVATSRMQTPRAYHQAVPISSGAMLVGGWTGANASSTTEIFDPVVRELRPGPDLIEERDFHAAVTLEDGRVLVVGGLRYIGSSAAYSLTAEIFDPSVGGFRETRTPPVYRRAGLQLTLLDGGDVLVTGGLPPGAANSAAAEIFDVSQETFRETSSPSLGFRQLHSATKLSGGAVLLSDGGNPKLEIYDPASDRFLEAGGASFVRRTRATASVLPGDRVLILGGFDQRGDDTLILESMDLYLPTLGGGAGRVVRPDVVLPSPRAGHTATDLDGGRIVFIGGFAPDGGDNLRTAFTFQSD